MSNSEGVKTLHPRFYLSSTSHMIVLELGYVLGQRPLFELTITRHLNLNIISSKIPFLIWGMIEGLMSTLGSNMTTLRSLSPPILLTLP